LGTVTYGSDRVRVSPKWRARTALAGPMIQGWKNLAFGGNFFAFGVLRVIKGFLKKISVHKEQRKQNCDPGRTSDVVSEPCVEPYRPTKVEFQPFHTTPLMQDSILQRQYNIAVVNEFGPLSSCPDDDIDASWNSFCIAIKSAATETRTAARKPWLSSETLAIIDLKAEARRNNNQAERKRLQSTFRAKAKADQESFLN